MSVVQNCIISGNVPASLRVSKRNWQLEPAHDKQNSVLILKKAAATCSRFFYATNHHNIVKNALAYELQRLGGWQTGAIVERYAHPAPNHLAAAASRLDSVLGVAATL
jgi:hypothetical protein